MQWLREELNKQKEFMTWFCANLAESAFLIICAFVQSQVNQVVVSFQLEPFDQCILFILQLLFAIATLIPIIAHICVGVVKDVVETRNAINKELEKLE